jgi:hypothetical protein
MPTLNPSLSGGGGWSHFGHGLVTTGRDWTVRTLRRSCRQRSSTRTDEHEVVLGKTGGPALVMHRSGVRFSSWAPHRRQQTWPIHRSAHGVAIWERMTSAGGACCQHTSRAVVALGQRNQKSDSCSGGAVTEMSALSNCARSVTAVAPRAIKAWLPSFAPSPAHTATGA